MLGKILLSHDLLLIMTLQFPRICICNSWNSQSVSKSHNHSHSHSQENLSIALSLQARRGCEMNSISSLTLKLTCLPCVTWCLVNWESCQVVLKDDLSTWSFLLGLGRWHGWLGCKLAKLISNSDHMWANWNLNSKHALPQVTVKLVKQGTWAHEWKCLS